MSSLLESHIAENINGVSFKREQQTRYTTAWLQNLSVP